MFFPNDSRRLPILPQGMELKKWRLSCATWILFVLISNTPNFCQLKIIGVTFIHKQYVYIISTPSSPNFPLLLCHHLLLIKLKTSPIIHVYTHVIYTHMGVCMCVYTCNLIRCCSYILPRAQLWVWMIYQGTYHCRRNNHPLAEAINFLQSFIQIKDLLYFPDPYRYVAYCYHCNGLFQDIHIVEILLVMLLCHLYKTLYHKNALVLWFLQSSFSLSPDVS